MSFAQDVPLPRDLADEISAELLVARRSLVRDTTRVEALEVLLDIVSTLSRRLGRPATLPDVLGATEPMERERRRRLIHVLRDRR